MSEHAISLRLDMRILLHVSVWSGGAYISGTKPCRVYMYARKVQSWRSWILSMCYACVCVFVCVRACAWIRTGLFLCAENDSQFCVCICVCMCMCDLALLVALVQRTIPCIFCSFDIRSQCSNATRNTQISMKISMTFNFVTIWSFDYWRKWKEKQKRHCHLEWRHSHLRKNLLHAAVPWAPPEPSGSKVPYLPIFKHVFVSE